MCTVLLPPGVNTIAVNKYIIRHIRCVRLKGGWQWRGYEGEKTERGWLEHNFLVTTYEFLGPWEQDPRPSIWELCYKLFCVRADLPSEPGYLSWYSDDATDWTTEYHGSILGRSKTLFPLVKRHCRFWSPPSLLFSLTFCIKLTDPLVVRVKVNDSVSNKPSRQRVQCRMIQEKGSILGGDYCQSFWKGKFLCACV